ncbi:MAG: class I adenylate-forming enzyme family protein, partial [Sphingomonadaceae bacterium]
MVTLPAVEAARRWPTAPALVAQGVSWTHAELEAASAVLARRLATAGVAPGDVVALWGANSPSWVLAAHAVGRAGATLLPLNTRWTDAEVAAALGRLAPRVLVGDAPLAARAAGLGVSAWSYEALDGLPPADGALPEAMPASAAMAYLLTSGTTGVPKAVTLTWGQVEASATAVGQVLALGPADRWWLAMPLFHVGGLGVLWRCAWHGAAAVIAPRFEAATAPAALARDGVTLASLVPTMLRGLLEALGDRPWPAAVRAVMLGGAAVPPDLVARCPVALAT